LDTFEFSFAYFHRNFYFVCLFRAALCTLFQELTKCAAPSITAVKHFIAQAKWNEDLTLGIDQGNDGNY
jgi:hypothetical protein